MNKQRMITFTVDQTTAKYYVALPRRYCQSIRHCIVMANPEWRHDGGDSKTFQTHRNRNDGEL